MRSCKFAGTTDARVPRVRMATSTHSLTLHFPALGHHPMMPQQPMPFGTRNHHAPIAPTRAVNWVQVEKGSVPCSSPPQVYETGTGENSRFANPGAQYAPAYGQSQPMFR